MCHYHYGINGTRSRAVARELPISCSGSVLHTHTHTHTHTMALRMVHVTSEFQQLKGGGVVITLNSITEHGLYASSNS